MVRSVQFMYPGFPTKTGGDLQKHTLYNEYNKLELEIENQSIDRKWEEIYTVIER